MSFSSKNKVKKLSSNKKIFTSLLVLSVFSFVFYLWQTNDLAIKGFKIKNLEENIADLREDNKNLELQINGLQSLSNIETIEKDLNMVKVKKVEYLSTFNSVVVR